MKRQRRTVDCKAGDLIEVGPYYNKMLEDIRDVLGNLIYWNEYRVALLGNNEHKAQPIL